MRGSEWAYLLEVCGAGAVSCTTYWFVVARLNGVRFP